MNPAAPPIQLSKSERRREVREASQLKVTLTTASGATRHITTKDRSFSGISFITDEPLPLGEDCLIMLENVDQTYARFMARVVRSLNAVEGKFEIALQFRRQIAA